MIIFCVLVNIKYIKLLQVETKLHLYFHSSKLPVFISQVQKLVYVYLMTRQLALTEEECLFAHSFKARVAVFVESSVSCR